MVWNLFMPVMLFATVALGVEIFLAVRRHPDARRWGVVAVVGVAAFPVAIVLHNVLSALIGGEEAVSFVVALLVAPLLICVGTLGAGAVVRRAGPDRALGNGLLVAGGGLAVLSAYMLFALVVTTIEGTNPPYQAPVEAVAMPVALVAIAVGVLWAALGILGGPPRTETAR